MSTRGSFDVVVAGGGVAGAAAAALLAAQGRRVALVERHRPAEPDPQAEFDPRVVAISPGAQRVLAATGGWSRLPPERVAPYRRMQVHANSAAISFAASEHGLDQLGWIVEVPVLQRALWQVLDELDAVTVIAPAGVAGFSLHDRGMTVRLENGDTGDQLRTALLVAADGARSRLRQAAGINSRQWHYNQHALVSHIRTQNPNPGLAWQRFTEYGPLALLPLSDGRSSIVWSQSSRRAARLRGLDESEFLDELNSCQDSPFGHATQATRRWAVPLIRRQAEHLVQGRLILLGDAARTVHPLAGQGLNLGLMDAAAITEVLHDWQPDQAPDRALARYERWRLSQGSLIAGGIHAINELTAGNFPGRNLAGLGFALANRAWPLRELFVKRACGIDSDSPQLARLAQPEHIGMADQVRQ